MAEDESVLYLKAFRGPLLSSIRVYNHSNANANGATHPVAKERAEGLEKPVRLDVNIAKIELLANSYPAKWNAMASAIPMTLLIFGVTSTCRIDFHIAMTRIAMRSRKRFSKSF